jgi:hypothetical protein
MIPAVLESSYQILGCFALEDPVMRVENILRFVMAVSLVLSAYSDSAAVEPARPAAKTPEAA